MAAFGPTIVGVIEAAGSDALGAAEDLVSNVVTEIGRLPGQVASAIAGAAGTIVGNITSALGSAINSAIDYINNHLPSLDVGPIHIGVPNLPHVNFASGGVVPGLPGAPVLAVVHGGEVVQNAAQQAHTLAAISNGAGIRGGGGGSKTYNINVNVAPGTDPGEVGRQTVMAIQAYERRAGSSWRAA
jgi:hypothetical protein